MSDDGIRAARISDWPGIERLLQAAGLPLAGAREHLGGFLVAAQDGAVVACGALERHGTSALLRSVAVDETRRGSGLGARIVDRLLAEARMAGVERVVLLTTTAGAWFPRFGFHPIRRDQVPEELLESAEFRGACPDTAVIMELRTAG